MHMSRHHPLARTHPRTQDKPTYIEARQAHHPRHAARNVTSLGTKLLGVLPNGLVHAPVEEKGRLKPLGSSGRVALSGGFSRYTMGNVSS